MSTTFEAVREELQAVSDEVHEIQHHLAVELGLEVRGETAGAASGCVAVELALQLMQTLVDEYLPELVKLRTFFETLLAINAHQKHRAAAVRSLQTIQKRMEKLCKTPFTTRLAEQFWEQDGNFHRTICKKSGSSHLAQVVDFVVMACREVGTPRTLIQMQDTCREHAEIVRAINTEPLDWRGILNAFRVHIEHISDRWKRPDSPAGTEDRMEASDEEGVPAEILASQAAFRRAFPKLLETLPGRWVAFHGDEQVCDRRSETDAYQECFRRGLQHGQFVVRYVDLVALCDEVF